MNAPAAPFSLRTVVSVLIVGPAAWMAYFWAVYLVGEWECTVGGPSTFPAGFTVAAAIPALAITVWSAWHAWSVRGRSDSDTVSTLSIAGMLSGVVSTIGVVFVAVTAVWIAPC